MTKWRIMMNGAEKFYPQRRWTFWWYFVFWGKYPKHIIDADDKTRDDLISFDTIEEANDFIKTLAEPTLMTEVYRG